MTSPEFAAFLQAARERAKDVAFVIGGAHGLAESVRAAAQKRIALAPFTLHVSEARPDKASLATQDTATV